MFIFRYNHCLLSCKFVFSLKPCMIKIIVCNSTHGNFVFKYLNQEEIENGSGRMERRI